jgi:choline-glycine betaine transporter
MSERSRILSGLSAEVVFAALPLFVVLIVLAHADHSRRLFMSPEWSFGAAILFGQSLTKFVSGLTRGGKAARGPVTLVLALVIVFGLVPSLLVLYITLQTVEAKTDPSRWLQFFQVILFCGAAAMYLLLGAIGELWGRQD